jgi:hypothetical protein
MRELIEAELTQCRQYLDNEGENETDRSFFEGRIDALEWVTRQLPEEG